MSIWKREGRREGEREREREREGGDIVCCHGSALESYYTHYTFCLLA